MLRVHDSRLAPRQHIWASMRGAPRILCLIPLGTYSANVSSGKPFGHTCFGYRTILFVFTETVINFFALLLTMRGTRRLHFPYTIRNVKL